MEPLNRRSFLKRAGITAAAAGAVAAAPGGIGAIGAAGATTKQHAPEALLSHDEAEQAPQVVAHVKDAGTGEIALYVGEREVTIRDRHVAARLVRATR